MRRLDDIWESNRGSIRRLLLRLAGDAELADDLLQETYLRASGGISGCRSEDPRAWLAAIARNVFYAHRRQRSSRSECPLERDVGDELGAGMTDEVLTKLDLHNEIACLPRPFRAPLIMKYFDGLTYAEIASRLNCPIGTAKWRVSVALSRLRSQFGVTGKEVARTMVKSLREDVLDQLALQPLRFSVSPGNCSEELRSALRIAVTEVFGSSHRITDGSNYLVCGNYTLAKPIVDSMVLAARGKTTGYHAFLSPGEGSFELYGHVIQALPGRKRSLSIMAFPDGGECTLAVIRLQGPKQTA